jgi:hypothetical protein
MKDAIKLQTCEKHKKDARCTNNKANRRVLSGCLTTISKGILQDNESSYLSKDE